MDDKPRHGPSAPFLDPRPSAGHVQPLASSARSSFPGAFPFHSAAQEQRDDDQRDVHAATAETSEAFRNTQIHDRGSPRAKQDAEGNRRSLHQDELVDAQSIETGGPQAAESTGPATIASARQQVPLPSHPPLQPFPASHPPADCASNERPGTGQCAPELSMPPHDYAGQHLRRTMPDSPSLGPGRPESLLASPLTHPNGTSMFPSLSTAEQENMAREALSQAEDSIVADVLEEQIVGDESDGGYSSDGFSSGSTSAESSVRDYLYENGRRYHRFREGIYNFPNDDVEQEREDMKHAMVKLLCSQKLHFAPIGNHPQQVLDMGTGTGIWAIEMGDQFPSAHVLGVDLSPIQPDWLPPNVRFLVDDVESPWLYPRNHFDYIHSRHTVMAVRDWPRLFSRAFEHVKPGGWIELQEIHHKPRSAHADGVVPADHAVAKFWARVNEGLTTLGIDLDRAAGGFLGGAMRQSGFVNVTERVFHVPIGTWPKNKVLKTVGLYWRTILLDGLQAIALGPLTRGLHWSRDEVELFLMDVRRAYHDNGALMFMPLHIIYGQKPT